MNKSISFIGMAGAGKSSIGKMVADSLNFNFIDSDLLIESDHKKSLQDLLEKGGLENFKKIEEKVLLSVKFNNTVLATGGSAVFSSVAMNHIKSNSMIIYIEVPYEDIIKRVTDFSKRGFVKDTNQTILEAFEEREAIYKKFANHIVQNNGSLESCFEEVLSLAK